MQNIEQRVIGDKNKGCAMLNTEKRVERREHKRFMVQEGIYVLLKNNSSKLGQIKNISRGGLAFTYIVNGEAMHESFKVDIFISGRGFCLKDIPSKKISDFHINNKLPFTTFAIRKVGIQFNELNQSQLSQLDNFMRDHTAGEQS
ncbi:MAG: PilZ domain-containing protein [Thermodesulfobacteriota bacterium]|nr:PilZ domain-containing protein [Thermodesulfobacteriota bacterium]